MKQQQWVQPQGGVQPQQYVQQWDATKTPRPNVKQRKSSLKKCWQDYNVAGGGNQPAPPAAAGQPMMVNGQWMVPAAAPQAQAATGGNPGSPANASLSEADKILKAQVKDLCYYHQGHMHSMTCDGYLAGACKKRYELVPSKRAFALMPVPNEVQQKWKKYRDACNQWGTVSSDPIQAANAKGKKGGGKGDPKGGKA